MSREITVDWPWPGEWESVEDVSAFYKDRLYPALSDYIGGIAESDTYIDHVVGPFTIGNLTKGSVLFAGTNGVVSQDNDDLFWDATNIRLGINVGTSPSVPLDVGGDCKFDGAVTINDANADKDFRIEGSGATYTHLLFTDASTNRVGINLSSPLCLTHIRGAVCTDYAGINADTVLLLENDNNVALTLQGATGSSAYIEFCDDAYNPPAGRVAYDFANEWMEFIAGTNELMWLDTTQLKIQNIVNSAEDTNATSIFGRAKIGYCGWTDAASFSHYDQNTTTAYCLLQGADGATFLNSATGTSVKLRVNNVDIMVLNATDVTLADGIGFNLQEDITFTGATTVNQIKFPDHLADALSFKEATNTYLTFVTTNGSESVTFGKNVIIPDAGYIGSASDTDAMQIEADGDIVISQDLAITGTLGVTGIATLASGSKAYGSGAVYYYAESSDGVKWMMLANANAYGWLGTFSNHAFYLGTNNSGKVYIDSSGNVGIGQTSFGTNADTVFAQGTGGAPTTSPANCFQMYSADIGATAGKAGAHFRDEEGNIVSIGSGGILMSGTARVNNHVRITAPSWKAGSTAPTAGFVGIAPTWKFGKATDDEVHYSLIVPYRIATGSTINVNVDWTYTGTQDNGTVCWKLEYKNVASGETIVGGTSEITKTSVGTHTTGTLIRTTLTTGITGAVAHDDLMLRLWRDSSEDTLDTTADMIQVHFEFLRDKLGKPT